MTAPDTRLADAALAYAAQGLLVLPLGPRAKRPLGHLVPHGLRDASADPERVGAWWRSAPMANIGLVTGRAFNVLDVDPRHGGNETLAALVAKYGPLPVAPESATGGGGRHVFHESDPRVCCSTGRLGDGLDVKASGGFIVAPPSIHPNGRSYAWTVRGIPPPPWPSWMLTLILPVRAVQRPAAPSIVRLDGRCSPYGLAVLRAACERVEAAPEGRRHDVLKRRALVVAGYVAGGEIDEGLARDCLRAASTLPEAETLSLIGWAFQNGRARPLAAPERRAL